MAADPSLCFTGCHGNPIATHQSPSILSVRYTRERYGKIGKDTVYLYYVYLCLPFFFLKDAVYHSVGIGNLHGEQRRPSKLSYFIHLHTTNLSRLESSPDPKLMSSFAQVNDIGSRLKTQARWGRWDYAHLIRSLGR